MLRLAGFALLVALAASSGCGGSSAAPADSGAADGPRDGASSVSIPGVTGLVASNGLPIPDPPFQDPCTSLAVTAIDCGPTDTCPALTCECGGVPLKVEIMGSCMNAYRCLTGVSCPAVCATSDLGASVLPKCVYSGVCESDADCTKPGTMHCLRALDGTAGHCISGQGLSDCYANADCASMGCVAIEGVLRVCQDVDKTKGAFCNRDEQCPPSAAGPGARTCLLRDGEIFGPCTNGAEGTACLAGTDCLPGSVCLKRDPGFGSCSSGARGAPCLADTDCQQGFCVNAPDLGGQMCQTGEVNAPCGDASDCQAGLRCAFGYPSTCQM